MSANQAQLEIDPKAAGVLWAGRYRLQETRLGAGGMGSVYVALDEHLQAKVVVKTPLPELLKDPVFLSRFDREVRAMVRLRHPGIVTVLDYYPDHTPPFFVLEYMEMGTLAKSLKPQGGSVRAAIWWLMAIARALDYIHSQGHAHRDVKPANILIDRWDQVRLGDFGVVKAFDAGPPLTSRGGVLGSPSYMGPEILGEDHFTHLGEEQRWFRSDQHALAVTVYEVLTGKPPFNLLQRLDPNCEAKPVHLTCPTAPPALSTVLDRGFAFDPRQRFESCEAFARSVLAAVEPAMHLDPASDWPGSPRGAERARGAKGKGALSGWRWLLVALGGVLAVTLSIRLTMLALSWGPFSTANIVRSPQATEPGELVVSPDGPYRSLAAALAVAGPADRIRLRPGVYEEGPLTLEGVVRIVGDETAKVQITVSGPLTVAAGAHLTGLTLRPRGRFDGPLVQATGGAVRFEDCTLEASPNQEAVMAVTAGTLVLVGCRLAGGVDGLVARKACQAELERCEIHGQARRALVAGNGASLFLRGCKRIQGSENGLEVVAGGRAELVDCDVYGAKTGANVDVAKDGAAVIRQCRVSGGDGVASEGQTTLEGCDLTDCDTGVRVMGGTLRLSRCAFARVKQVGLFVSQAGRPQLITVVGCSFKGGNGTPVKLFAGKSIVFHDCVFEAGQADEAAVELAHAVNASFWNCTLAKSRMHLVALWDGAAAALSGCQLTGAAGAAVWAKGDTTTVVLDACTVKGNAIGVKGEGAVLLVVRNTSLEGNTRPSETTPQARLITLGKAGK